MSTTLSGHVRRLAADERARFLITGGINTLVGYGLFALVQATAGPLIGYLASLLIAHLLTSLLAFTLYRRYVFRVTGSRLLDFVRFQTVYLIPLAANVIALPLLVEVAGLSVYLAQAIIVVASTLISFLGHKFFSFRRRAER